MLSLIVPDSTLQHEIDRDAEFTQKTLTRRMDQLNKMLDHFRRFRKTENI